MGIIDINNIDLTIGKTNILKNITVSFDEGKNPWTYRKKPVQAKQCL